MNQSNHALLIYTDYLRPDAGLAYVLATDHAGVWQISAHIASELPNLTRASDALTVDAGADLRMAELGAITTVTKVTAS